jgi:hypothetical protein
MAKATSSEFYERQQALQLREAELLHLAEPEDGPALAWHRPLLEQVRDERRRPW